MKPVLLFLFVFSTLFSCGGDQSTQSNSRFQDGRQYDPTQRPRSRRSAGTNLSQQSPERPELVDKTGTNAQSNTHKTPKVSSADETIRFPLSFKTKHESISLKLLAENDHTKVSISAKPDSKPMTLVPSLSGKIAIKTGEDIHTLTIKSGVWSVHFELDKLYTTLLTQNGATVNKGVTRLAEVKKPITYYIQKNGVPLILCLSLENAPIRIEKSFSNHESCPK